MAERENKQVVNLIIMEQQKVQRMQVELYGSDNSKMKQFVVVGGGVGVARWQVRVEMATVKT